MGCGPHHERIKRTAVEEWHMAISGSVVFQMRWMHNHSGFAIMLASQNGFWQGDLREVQGTFAGLARFF